VPTAGSLITTATGSVGGVTGVTSISSATSATGSPVPGAYNLQVNTNPFASTACAGSPNAGCQGWEQFVFINDGSAGQAFIQYWLLQYNTTCPSGWIQFTFSGFPDIYCYRNAPNSVPTPNQPITNLAQMSLSGTVTAAADSVTFTSGTNAYSANGDNAVNAAAGWNATGFGIFGYCCGSEADFNAGSTIVPRTQIIYGGVAAPSCLADGFTGETNNLNFGAAPAASAPGPAVLSTQSTTGGAVASCANATSVGDTHLTTFGGLLYDFQASGDFILAEIDPEFLVQARQVSGAPSWPNASVNHGVGMRLDGTEVAICLKPELRVVVGNGSD
jgi:hypothetical protein